MTIYKYLNPKNDVAFKRIFGTEKNKDILINFLNEVLKNQLALPIEDVTFLKPVQDPEIASKKQSIVDVLCRDKHGVQYIIEMQVAKTSGFEERAQFYAAKAYIDQMNAGNKNYQDLKEVIFIAIADYDIFPDKKNYKSEHVILDRVTLANDLKMFSFTFVNLPKFAEYYENSKKEVSDLSLEERWYYFLKNAEGMSDAELESLAGKDIEIKAAYREVERFNWTEPELWTYERELKRERDEYCVELYMKQEAERIGMEKGMEKGMQKGMQKGIEKGLKEGMEKGRKEGIGQERVEMARKMLAKGLSNETISEMTGFSKSELETL